MVDGALAPPFIVAGVTPDMQLQPGQLDAARTATSVWAADLKITPDGRFLYATERTSSSIIVFGWNKETWRLRRSAAVPTEKQPRGIAINASGTCLVASGEKSDHIASYRIDQATGELTAVSRAPVSSGANWVEIATLA